MINYSQEEQRDIKTGHFCDARLNLLRINHRFQSHFPQFPQR